METLNIALAALKTFNNSGNVILVHGSVVVNDSNAEIALVELKVPNFKETTLSLRLDIKQNDSAGQLQSKCFSLVKNLEYGDIYDQVELISLNDTHLLVDIDEGELESSDLAIETDLRQNIFAAEKKLDQLGSLVVMSKKGSKLKDNK